MASNNYKRKYDTEFQSQKRNYELGETVAKHYNSREDQGLKDREKSRIFHMRNYNNWIKSMLINDAINIIKADVSGNRKISVLDFCSGKGGDLLKWKMAGVDRVTCVDIAETSVEHSKTRYEDLIKRSSRDRRPIFSSQFFQADCSKTRIRSLLNNPNEQFDLTSCQFAFHYSFESLPQAKMMLQNACVSLKPGGLFIGTIPNSNILVKRLRESENMSFGNDVYKVEFNVESKQNIPIFGAKYNFFLEGAVNCPEFLVYFPLLEELASNEGMKLISCHTFKEFHDIKSDTREGQTLLKKMMALEPYPPQNGGESAGKPEDYEHAKSYLERKKIHMVSTLSKSEWEATNLYMVFMFQKVQEESN